MSEPEINTFRMRREESGRVTLEFGHRARPEDGLAPPDPAYSFVARHQIDLSPNAAWRLVHGLSDTLHRPLAAGPSLGAVVPAAAPSTQPAPMPSPRAPTPGTRLDLGASDSQRQRGSTPLNLPHSPMAEQGDWLRAAVRDMAPLHFHERSFRIAPGQLQSNRFLLSVNSRELPPDALERSWAICQHLGMPAALRPQVEAALAQAAHLHFGFEGETDQILCKLYVERAVSGLDAARAREQGEPALQYVAFKWDTSSGRHVVAHYHWHAGLSAAAIGERIAMQFEGADPALAAQANQVLGLAAQRLPADRLLYLEVTEDGQPRRSFDLNAYDANLSLRDFQGALFAMRDAFGIGPSRFQVLYDQVKGKRFGHLAGGIHRDGRPFFNVYFGGVRQA